MARLTATLGPVSGPPTKAVAIEHKLLDLNRDENITEWYLKINPKGQAPAMTVQGRPAPLTDSRDISYWFCEIWPNLLPKNHEGKIHDLLAQLHAIEGISLSVPRPEQPNKDLLNKDCDKILARTDISDTYRRAVEYKRQVDYSHWPTSLHHVSIDKAQDQAKALFEVVLEQHQKHGDDSPWIFGKDIGPTVLDAHIVPFIARLDDAGRAWLVPEVLLQYAQAIKGLPQYYEVTKGRRTMWNSSYGHVHLLVDI
ncbi:hypothetical protein JX266_013343 [Neoarthrinium moseri]|nr:hypothetical protein JX266_013343 [Neoarthrinium moseri]